MIARAKASGTSSALLEVCFIDDKDDMQIYTAKDQIAAAIATAIAEQFGLKKNGNNGNQGNKGITVGSTVTIKRRRGIWRLIIIGTRCAITDNTARREETYSR